MARLSDCGRRRSLVKMLLTTGTVTTICALPAEMRGAVWGRDGTIIFGLNAGPLHRVNADGGTPQPLAPLRPGEHAHRWPALLPDGEHVLFTSGGATNAGTPPTSSPEPPDGESRSLELKGMPPRFVAPTVWCSCAIRSCWRRLRSAVHDSSGAATLVVDDVSNVWAVGAAHYAVSDSGTLVFVSDRWAAMGSRWPA